MSNAVSSKRAEPSYTFQRVHAALQTGHALTVQQKREEPVPVFMQQSVLDARFSPGETSISSVQTIISVAGLRMEPEVPPPRKLG